jgi:hypothetical protein
LFFSAFYEKVALIRFSISSVCDVFLQLWHFETGWFKGRVASRYRLQIIVALMAAVETEVQGNPGFEGGVRFLRVFLGVTPRFFAQHIAFVSLLPSRRREKLRA